MACTGSVAHYPLICLEKRVTRIGMLSKLSPNLFFVSHILLRRHGTRPALRPPKSLKPALNKIDNNKCLVAWRVGRGSWTRGLVVVETGDVDSWFCLVQSTSCTVKYIFATSLSLSLDRLVDDNDGKNNIMLEYVQCTT